MQQTMQIQRKQVTQSSLIKNNKSSEIYANNDSNYQQEDDEEEEESVSMNKLPKIKLREFPCAKLFHNSPDQNSSFTENNQDTRSRIQKSMKKVQLISKSTYTGQPHFNLPAIRGNEAQSYSQHKKYSNNRDQAAHLNPQN